MRTALRLLVFLALASAGLSPAAARPYLQSPALSKDLVAFAHGGDLWTVGRAGGDALRLTAGVGIETDPAFSPDGRLVAFSGEYEGNFDIYVVDAAGGVPRRLTWHPSTDRAVGWTPDGRRIVFRSGRSGVNANRLYMVSLEGGGLPEMLPLPEAEEGSFSPDGARLAYVPYRNRFPDPGFHLSWKRYRGGTTSPLWIARLADSSVEAVPRDGSNDWNPMWVGERVYFLSDRNGRAGLFAFEPATRRMTEVVAAGDADIVTAAAGPGAIVYARGGALHLLDLASGQGRELPVRVVGDLPGVRPRWVPVAQYVQNAALSPTGVRAVFEARGEIVTVPAKKGDARNLTGTPGVAERDPAWSPDGTRIAYFSDASGEYALHVADQSGSEAPVTIALGEPPSYFYAPRWSPDSTKIAFHDKRLKLWYVDLAGKAAKKPAPVPVDETTYDSPFRRLDPVWSPDSRFIAYAKQLPTHMHAIFVHSLDGKRSWQITDGMSDALHPAFDRDGKHLYFTASTDVGPTLGWLDLSSVQRLVSRNVYVVVLAKGQGSPLAPESDEEKGAATGDEGGRDEKDSKDGKDEEKKDDGEAKKEETPKVVVDVEGIDQRTLALPVPARHWVGLVAGKAGQVFLLEAEPGAVVGFGGESLILHRFDLEKRETTKLAEGLALPFAVSHDGEKMLARQGEKWLLAGTAEPLKPGEGTLALDGVTVRVEPPQEWRQIFRETWRIQRDFFYDPGWHGLDIRAEEKRWEPFLDGLAHRADLNAVFDEMLGELVVGHLYVGGGDSPEINGAKGGLLGAEYELANGRYRFARVYSGESWNPQLRAPLTQPGVEVKKGEYLLAVGGRELTAADDVDSFFEGTGGKQVKIRVGPTPDGKGAREVVVVPVETETQLQTLAWIEDNRRKVDALSGGRLAYVYLPDTAMGGYAAFNRYFFAQVGKAGVVIDERYNGGGLVADYIIDYLRRPLLSWWTTREGKDFTTPVGAIFGPKVMIINHWAGSGGDALPYYFRSTGLGPLIGTRTWGGLVGIYDYPTLVDGGFVTSPRMAFYTPEGEWAIENQGVPPDIEVQLDPAAWRKGGDPQLEKAVEVALDLLAKSPPPAPPAKPAYPRYHGVR